LSVRSVAHGCPDTQTKDSNMPGCCDSRHHTCRRAQTSQRKESGERGRIYVSIPYVSTKIQDALRMLKDNKRNRFRYIEVYRPLAHGTRLENDALVFVPGVQIGPRPPQFTPLVLWLSKVLNWCLWADFCKDSARSTGLNGGDLWAIGPSDVGCRRAPEFVLNVARARVANGAYASRC
jgi:hypothetical protein